MTVWEGPHNACRRRLQDVGRGPPMVLHIGKYGDVLRTTFGRPLDVIFQSPKDVGRGRPQDVGRGHPLVLHRGPYGDAHRTTFGIVLRTSWGRNFTEWGGVFRTFSNI